MPPTYGAILLNDSEIAISIDNNPNKVVNLIIGFRATEEVSLNGSPTVSPTTVASCLTSLQLKSNSKIMPLLAT